MTLSPARIIALIALIFGTLAASITDPAAFGLSDTMQHWIQLLAQVASTVAAFLAVPPMRRDDTYIDMKGRE